MGFVHGIAFDWRHKSVFDISLRRVHRFGRETVPCVGKFDLRRIPKAA